MKITDKSTFYEVQEHCKSIHDDCNRCGIWDFCKMINSETTPSMWGIERAKTYKEDFSEKFPNHGKNEDGDPNFCPFAVYGGFDAAHCKKHHCHECWYLPMESEQ